MWSNEEVVSNLDVVLKDAGLPGGRDNQYSGEDHEESNSSSTSDSADNGMMLTETGEDVMDNVTSVPLLGQNAGSITVVSSVGSYAPTLSNVQNQKDNMDEIHTCVTAAATASAADVHEAAMELLETCSTSTTACSDQVLDTCHDVVSSLGSFAPTLAEAFGEDGMSSVGSFAPTLAEAHRNAKTNSSNASKFSSVASTISHQSVFVEDKMSVVSSVGGSAPTLATHRSSKTLKNKCIQVHDPEDNDADEMSSVGMSRAPTLATRSSAAPSVASPSVVYKDGCDIHMDNNSVVSSVGGSAPTLATHRSSKTLKNRCIQVKDPEDYDDGAMSSVGMSRAPTLATKSIAQSVASPSVAFKDGCDIHMDSSSHAGGMSSVGMSRAPTLTGILKKTNGQKRLSKQTMLDMDDISADKTGLSIDHYASDMDVLGGLLGRDNLKSGLEDVVGTFLRRGALVGVGIWIFLLAVMFMVAPASSYQYSTGPEQMANATLLTLLVGVNLNRLSPYVVNDRNYNFLKSGPMMASCVVQVIAMASVAAMLFLPTPVIVDPFVGVRCHLVRWVEWTALAFVMTFLTESIDLPLEDADTKHAWIVAIMIALSTACGAIMPFCPNEACWWAVFATSCLLFTVIYARLAWRGVRLWNMPKAVTTSDMEDHERAKYSFKLMAICAVLWTILASTWTACALLHNSAKPDSIWANDWLILATENFCEAMSKLCYLSMLMETHECLFDDANIAARRLRELRSYMSAVWAASTDVVIVCSRHDHMVNAAVSPAFFQMEHAFGTYVKPGNKRSAHDNHEMTLAMEVDPYVGSYRTYEMDFTKPLTRDAAKKMMSNSRNKARMVTPVFEKNLKVLSDLVCDACTMAVPEGRKQYIMRKNFYCLDMERNQKPLYCEAKVVKLQDKAFLIVLRDVKEHTVASIETCNVTTWEDDAKSH